MKLILLFLAVAMMYEKTSGVEFFMDDPLEGGFVEDIFGDDGCHCQEDKCNCCKTLSLPRIQFSKTACISLEFNNTEQAFHVKFMLDQKEIFDKQVQGKHPRPLCVSVPLMKHLVSICIELSDIKMDSTGLKGCVNLVATAIQEHKFQIGCFKMPTAFLRDDAEILIFEREIKIRNLMS
ncbi:uncharacterized protein LOC133204861 [Saccostrea echinata]|uniref:uncharacterized protein LOC133204861 n=1 Tax=Saccostrea echinata TaxID=191078 RepID=UPI002A822522|nr:uncharacterized protein LOC133204861 [Saccostrea echinata]